MGWMVNGMSWPLLLPGKTRYQYRRLRGPQGPSGRVRRISFPPGFDPRTVQPVRSESLYRLSYSGMQTKAIFFRTCIKELRGRKNILWLLWRGKPTWSKLLCERPIIVRLDKFLASVVLWLHCIPLLIAREGRVNQPYLIRSCFSTVFPCTPHILCLCILVLRIKFCILLSSPLVRYMPFHLISFCFSTLIIQGVFYGFFRSTEAFSHRNFAFVGTSNEQSSPEHPGR